MLPADVHNEGGYPRLVLVHGFTQTGGSWAPLLPAFSEAGCEVLTVDLPGHGRAGHLRADLRETAQHLAETGGPAVYMGYSLGGRVVLHLTLARPDLVAGVVLVGATPGIDDDGERTQRRSDDEVLAARIGAVGVDAFLDDWLALPLFATLTATAADRQDRRTNTTAGLAASLLLSGSGTQQPLWEHLSRIVSPALLVVGARDHKFSKIATRMARRWGGPCRLASVADAGHAAHLEQPEAVTELVLAFLASPQIAAPPPLPP